MNLKEQVSHIAGSSGAGGRSPLDAELLEPVLPADVGVCWLEMGWLPAALHTSMALVNPCLGHGR